MIVQRSFEERDLAPGDKGSVAFDWSGFQAIEVSHPDDPDFERFYQVLAEEFGPRREMESREVIRQRLSWSLTEKQTGFHLRYRMAAVEKNGRIAGIHDHTVAVKPYPAPEVCVHLSHIFVAPEWRRTGLAGWLRTVPVADARRTCLDLGFAENTPTILAAEMEPLEKIEQLPRLLAYARAGYRRLDPSRVNYHQPDFRSAQEMAKHGGPQPLPLWLMIRNLADEPRDFLTGQEVSQTLAALYAIYGQTFRKEDMAAAYVDLGNFALAERIALQDIRSLPSFAETWL